MISISRFGQSWVWAVVLLVCSSVAPAPEAAGPSHYKTTTIKGAITDPATRQPMAGATIRFTAKDEAGVSQEAVTDADGQFEVKGLTYSRYEVEIETADGEVIKGINALPLREGEQLRVDMRISDRFASTTTVENQPGRFLAIVKVEPPRWGRFWKQFAIFLGAAGGAAAAGL